MACGQEIANQEQNVSPRQRQAQIELLTPILTCNIQKPFSTGVADSLVGAVVQGRIKDFQKIKKIATTCQFSALGTKINFLIIVLQK